MARYLARNDESDRRFSFIDGPITANNPMGVHHAWGRTYKDLFQRYHTMLGERQRYQNGFDCQGLWIEVEVENELGLHQQAPDRGVRHRPIRRAVQGARRALRRPSRPSSRKRLGYWMDWDNSYYTNSDENNYTIWAFLAEVPREGPALQGPRRHAVVPALRHRHQQHGDGRGLPRGQPPVRHAAAPAHQRGARRARTCWSGRRRRGRCRATSPRPSIRTSTTSSSRAADGRRWWVSAGSTRSRGRATRPCSARSRGADLVEPHLRRALRRAAGRRRRRASGHRVGRRLRCRGHRHRPHRSGLRAGGLRAVEGERPGGHRPDRPVRGLRAGFGWQSGRYAGATDDATRTWRAMWSADLDRKGLLVAKEATRTATRTAGGAAPSSSSASSTSGSSPWTRCASRSAPRRAR